MAIFGWKAAPEQFEPGPLLEAAVAAEAAGFEALDVSDHYQPWAEAGHAAFAWTWLGAAAVRTQRMRLGTGLTCPILRYNPAIIAQAAATLGVMAPGRAYLSVGTGEALNEYPVTHQWPDYAERQDRLAEAVSLIRQLWTGEKVTFEGTYYQTYEAQIYTLPEQPLPIYISSLAPGSADFAGRHGDGLITVGGKSKDVYREILERFRAGAEAAGKDAAAMPKLIELSVEYTDDVEEALKPWHTYWAGSFVPALFLRKIYTPTLSQENGQVVGDDVLQQKVRISADPADHVALVKPYRDMGFTHFFFHSAAPDQRAFLERYGRDVLPKLRELG